MNSGNAEFIFGYRFRLMTVVSPLTVTPFSPLLMLHSGPTLNFQKFQDLVTKNPKIEQKFPSYTENTRKRWKWEQIYSHKFGENIIF